MLAVHCSLRPTAEGCAVELNELAPEPFSYHGKLSRGCVVAWGQDLFFGSTRLTLLAEGGAGSSKSKQSPVVWAVAVALPLLVAMAFFAPADGAPSSVVPEEPPALFGQLPPCSESKEGAVGRAAVAEQVALGKHERGVFELKDSVDSVELMREAAVCYALGENQGASDRTLDRAEEWIADLQFSYKRALLDLEIGRRAQAGTPVLGAISRLQVLLSRSGPSADVFKQRLAQLRLGVVVALEEARRAKEEKKP